MRNTLSTSAMLDPRSKCRSPSATQMALPNREATDRTHCIISAVAVFAVKFAPEKIRAVATRPDPGVLSLYDWGWEPIMAPFQGPTDSMTSLGVTGNLVCERDDQFQYLRTTLLLLTLRRGRQLSMENTRSNPLYGNASATNEGILSHPLWGS